LGSLIENDEFGESNNQQVRSMSGQPETEYGARRAAYDIKKLRAKGMVRKIGKSRRPGT
jgi:hypothetical protein